MSNYSLHVSLKTKFLNFLRGVFKISFLEKWLAGNTVNKPTHNIFVKLIPPNYTYPSNSIREATRGGIQYALDLSDYVEHFIFWGIKDAGHETLYKSIKPGMNVFDVGANIGDTALHFSKSVGSAGKVFAFEPDPANYIKLQTNIAKNNASNITSFNIGLGSERGTMKLYKVDPNNKGMNRMFLNRKDDSDFVEVSIEKVDDVMNQLSYPEIDFIKIDVEGFELEVLKGAKQLLEKFKPELFIEMDDSFLNANNASIKQVIQFLSEMNYKIQVAQTGKIITTDTESFAEKHFDVLCTKI